MQALSIRTRTIRRAVTAYRFQLMSVVVLGWSTDFTVRLALSHTTGAESYGVLIAMLAIGGPYRTSGCSALRTSAWS